jgi:hypothetical protein
MKSPFASFKLIAFAILLAGTITNAPAIAIRNATGVVIEVGYLSGTVSRVDQSRHGFTVTWKGNAASISGLLLTTEALVCELPEKDKPAPAGGPGGGMGGMGGMDY